MPIDNACVDVVMVGGGPSALWLANQIQIQRPQSRIVLLEKREQYQRTHTVKLSPRSFAGAQAHPRLDALVNQLKHKRVFPLNQLEQELKGIATELGVEARLQNVTAPAQLLQDFPNAQFFIGADGAHSIVRKEIFKGDLKFNKSLQRIIEVKYDVWGAARSLKAFSERVSAHSAVQTLVSESVSAERDGKSTVILRFFVDEGAYQALKHARFNNPLLLSEYQDSIPAQLKADIFAWMNRRQLLLNERQVPASAKLNAIALDTYASTTFVKEGAKPNTTWALIGDAAFGVPFMRNLNASFLTGTHLAKAIVKSYEGPSLLRRIVAPIQKYFAGNAIEGTVPLHLIGFAAYIHLLSVLESIAARIKAIAVTVLRAVASLSFCCHSPSVKSVGAASITSVGF